jgi:hypothetical protein
MNQSAFRAQACQPNLSGDIPWGKTYVRPPSCLKNSFFPGQTDRSSSLMTILGIHMSSNGGRCSPMSQRVLNLLAVVPWNSAAAIAF